MREGDDRSELLEALVERLRDEGTPEGAWLLDIERSRRCLHDADDVLRRLKETIIRSAGGGPMAVLSAILDQVL